MLAALSCLAAAQPELQPDPDDYAWRDEFVSMTGWQAQPGWLSNPSPAPSATAADGAACFKVEEAGRGMKWSRDLPQIPLADFPWLVMRCRARDLDPQRQDYLIYLRDGDAKKELAPVKPRDLPADGQWHVLAVDVSTLTERATVDLLAIQVQATGAGQARLWLDWIGFTDAPPGDATILRGGRDTPPQPDWVAPLAQAAWSAQPSWLGNPAAADRHGATVTNGVTHFQIAAPNQGMKWTWSLPEPVGLAGQRYVTMRYRARGASPHGHYTLCFIGNTRSKGSDYRVILAPSELIADGRWHTAWAQLAPLAAQLTNVTALACELQALEAEAELAVDEIRLSHDWPTVPFSDFCAWRAGADFTGFRTIPIEAGAKADRPRWLTRLRLAGWPETNRVTAEGIPFSLGDRLAATPLSQKTALRLPAGLQASEVYVLLLAKFIGPEEAAFGEGRFKAVRDLDRFRLRLEYADGTADECLPLDAASREFGVTRSAQVLVAAADAAKTLREVVVMDQTRQAAFAVAALTARVDGRRGFPESLEDGPLLTHKPAGRQAPSRARFEVRDRSLHIANGPLGAEIDLEGQPRLRRLQDTTTGWSLLREPTALLDLTIDGKTVPQAGFICRDISPTNTRKGREAGCAARYMVAAVPDLTLSLTVEVEASNGLAMQVALTNHGSQRHRILLTAPRLGPYRLSADAEAAWYLFPRRGALFDNRPAALRERYSGLFPLQFMDTFAPAASRGLSLRTEDTRCVWKHYALEKKNAEFVLAVEYAEQTLHPGEHFDAPRAVLSLTDGSWQRGLAAYRDWVRSWYQPDAPRKPWFREVFNFRQRFLHGLDPLYDGRQLDLQRAVSEAEQEFGGIEYLHLFDWGNAGPHGRTYGRTGDPSPFDYLEGGQPALREAIRGVQARGIPVGLYIEGYLLDERGPLGRRSGKDWQMIDAAGRGARWPDSTEIYACSYVPQWRQVQTSTYAAKAQQLGPDGMYIDEFGFAGPNVDCWSKDHGHPRPGYAVVGERDCTRLIRQSIEAAKPGVAIYTEESPADMVSQFQDGSFTYAMLSARQAAARVPLNLTRFALPDFKTIEILFCDKPTGSWATGVKWVFFNGEALWLEGPASEWFEPETRAAIRQCHRILRQHRDAFTTGRPVPLVPTLRGGVYANAFPVAGKTVYTLYNSRHRTVRGDVLEVPWQKDAAWEDVWHGKPALVRRLGAKAILSTELEPNGVGCFCVRGK